MGRAGAHIPALAESEPRNSRSPEGNANGAHQAEEHQELWKEGVLQEEI